MKRAKLKNKQVIMFLSGLLAFVIGSGILAVYGFRHISRELRRQKLMQENVVIEIADLNIKAPVLEGIDNDTLSIAAGHFTGTGKVGSGNYCIAGHSSTIYKEYFNNLKNIKPGMEIHVYDTDENHTCYIYKVTENFIVEPDEIWILDDFGDDRVTVITCTDDGTQRQVVVGELSDQRNDSSESDGT